MEQNNENENQVQEILTLVKQCISKGYSPKKLLEQVFETIDKEIDNGKTNNVLFCASYGGFGLSNEFYEYQRQNPQLDAQLSHVRNYREKEYFFIEKMASDMNITLEEALKKSSDEYCDLDVWSVPKHRLYTIREYDGQESIQVLKDFSY
jgi:hypothetical protein